MAYWIVVTESKSSQQRVYPVQSASMAEAEREAREFLAGCIVGEGRVSIYKADPQTEAEPPIAVLKA